VDHHCRDVRLDIRADLLDLAVLLPLSSPDHDLVNLASCMPLVGPCLMTSGTGLLTVLGNTLDQSLLTRPQVVATSDNVDQAEVGVAFKTLQQTDDTVDDEQ
jgi:hypothetical protein